MIALSTATNPGNTVPPAPRPRLVAKSASGHQTSTPKSMNSASKNGSGSGPDPNQVWNRNRRMDSCVDLCKVQRTDYVHQLLRKQHPNILRTKS